MSLCSHSVISAESGNDYTVERNPNEPTFIQATTVDEHGKTVPTVYLGQIAQEGEIDLTPNNGFFDFNWCAGGDLGDSKTTEFEFYISRWKYSYLNKRPILDPNHSTGFGDARWHLWCPKSGKITATFYLEVPPEESKEPWDVKVGEEVQKLQLHSNTVETAPQRHTLTFEIKKAGKYPFFLGRGKVPLGPKTKVYGVRLRGSAIEEAYLLRGSWTPQGTVCGYCTPQECPAPTMWIFETQNLSSEYAYSPLLIRSGYFGSLFSTDGKVPKGRSFNFSMWASSPLPPNAKMPRLIGTHLPQAKWNSFGKEGAGIKFDDAITYPNGTDRIVQALRVEFKDHFWTYYAYWYDESAERWKLFASAQQYDEGTQNVEKTGTVREVGTYIEVPFSCGIGRIGDRPIGVKRRGWFYGSDQKLYRAKMGWSGWTKGEALPTDVYRAGATEKMMWGKNQSLYDERYVEYMNDYATDGWMAAHSGGFERYSSFVKGSAELPVSAKANDPEYLKPEKIRKLFELPVEFGAAKVLSIDGQGATVEYDIKKTGPNSSATLYYGTHDGITFARKDNNGHGSKAEVEMNSPERTWENNLPTIVIESGKAKFQLAGLESNTIYYFRLFVTHDDGKSWDYQSGKLTTK